MEGVAPIPLSFVLARLLWARSLRHPGALARVHLLPAVPVGVGGWGGGAGRAPAPLTGAAVPPGGGGIIPSASGGWGPAPLRLAGGRGGWGGGGAVPYPAPPLVVGAFCPGVRVRSGSRGSPVHRVRPAWRGWVGRRGGPWTAPPGAPSDRNPPSALPKWAALWVSLGMLWSWGALPPYCSGALPRAAPGRGLRAAPARWCGLPHLPRPPREQAAGGAGARGVHVQLCPHPPPASRSLLGEGGRPLGSGGDGGSALLRPSSRGGERGGGEGGPLCRPTPPRPVGCRPAIPCLRCAPPGYTRAVGVAGRPQASGAARSAANGSVRRGGGREGGSDLLAPAFPRPASEGAAPFAPSWVPPVRRRSVAGRAGACGRFTGGTCRGRGAPPPPLGAGASPGGCGAAVSAVCLHPLLGLRGGRRGGGLWSPGGAPPRARGGGLAVPAPGGQPSAGGSHSSPAPLYLARAGPSCRPWLGSPAPPAVVARRWLVGGCREGQRSAVSGLRGSGFSPHSLSPPSLPREVARAPP